MEDLKKASTTNPTSASSFSDAPLNKDGVITGDMSEEMMAKTTAIIEKVDKESATRKFTGVMQSFFYIFCILVSLYHLYTAIFGPPVTLVHRSLHVAMMTSLCFLMYPMRKKSSRTKPSILDWILALAAFAVPIYIYTDYLGVVERAGRASQTDMIMATLLVALVLEATRRCSGKALPLLSIGFILYGIYGREFPGMFMHRGYDWLSLSNHFFANTEGIYGTSVNVSASYIFLFILFGCVMTKSGMGKFFNDISLALAGHTKGGPAKVSVVAAGLLGSINGSAVANVVTTGSFTIPLMKKTGYSAEFSGAVSAAASVGGQLLPPIMGAAAFIMAEILGVKYSEIIVWAAIPALLYYMGILIQVQLRASKDGLVGVPKSQLPKAMEVLKAQGAEVEEFDLSLVDYAIPTYYTIAAAESCTAGMFTARLVNVAGASDVLNESFITYANEAKMKYLGVKEETLNTVGAVSEDTARQMAEGVARQAGSNVGVGITGLAGPGGETPEKKAGLVYIGVSVNGKTKVNKYQLNGNRQKVRETAVCRALTMVRHALVEEFL